MTKKDKQQGIIKKLNEYDSRTMGYCDNWEYVENVLTIGFVDKVFINKQGQFIRFDGEDIDFSTVGTDKEIQFTLPCDLLIEVAQYFKE